MTRFRTVEWRPTRALVIAVVFCAATLFLAITLHRPDLFAIGAPVVCLLVSQLVRVRPGGAHASLRARPSALHEGQRTSLDLVVNADPEADLVLARVLPGRYLKADTAAPHVIVPRERGALSIAAEAMRWGRMRSGNATVMVSASLGLFRLDARSTDAGVTVVPIREPFDAIDAVPHTSGVVGAHRSRRPGDGSELSTIRPFVAGDRLRRINWRVTQRTGALHVTATFADQDTAVMIVIDSAVDVSAREASATGGTIDIAVHAAASVAEHYLRHGDRVGFVDTAHPNRPVRPAAGRAHLDRIVAQLLDTVAAQAAREIPLTRVITQLTPRALVILLSPLIGPARPETAAELSRAGLPVIVVDTIGTQPPADLSGPTADLAYRMALLRRQIDIDRLAGHGVPVVAWQGANSLDDVLRGVARASRIPRMRA